ncbi:ribonucleoside-diphosphate reductase large subunit [Bacteriophage DSS3_VP1]|uniref:Ribonucleotide reductase alpha subunit n=1 Tax=Bacteriophage DSS3_VP1 TaxID=2664196 RepID=A0A7S5FRF6_9CAUD|nr:ribonucleoside-diphosphate reductase large subunit [Bacteriophage DSS3_VP1]QGH74646.1 ribonucleotide reductase alpha subunit [Bacteriophage DSS3_VP1]
MTNETFYWNNEDTKRFTGGDYLRHGETLEQRARAIADRLEEITGIPGIGDQFYAMLAKNWFSLSSPVWANFGRSGLPISCNNSYIPDDIAGMASKLAEVWMMTKHGAGTSGYFGDIRPSGSPIGDDEGKADGPVHFMRPFDNAIDVVSQGQVRRGNFAAYLPLNHPDIDDFLEAREEGHPVQLLSLGVTVTDEWLEEMVAGDTRKRKIWARVLRKRFESGFPYIVFHDNMNNAAPEVYKLKGMVINGSNLCSEIALASSMRESFVCDLGSMNLEKYDEWKDTSAVYLYTIFLDAVMSEYIEKVKDIPHMEAAYNFAKNQRALGVGVLGYHSYLQKNMIPFESEEARAINIEMHKHIWEETQRASRDMAKLWGEPELMKGTGLRNVTTMAIAPTKSSSFIHGQVSPSIEPWHSNYFTQVSAKGKFTVKNKWLEALIDKKVQLEAGCVDDYEYQETIRGIWERILKDNGSVQNLEFLSDHEKAVFKTFGELSQREIIDQAADRQPYIDQAQSLNVMIHPKTPVKDVNALYLHAWKRGIKSLYYQKGQNMAQEAVRNIMQVDCAACEA